MLDQLDSRALGRQDCYGQRFMKPGTYRYQIVPPQGECMTDKRPFAIKVSEGAGDGKMKQHTIPVLVKAGKFRVDGSPETVIDIGDLVLWNCPDPKALPFTIVGEKPFFASSRLMNESGYSHAFGVAGEYRWVDAHGSKVSGVVRVRDPNCKDPAAFEAWRKLLAKGTVVMIEGDEVEPREVEIVTGQTVFFAVRKAPGISITDERLISFQRKHKEGRSR